MRTAFCNVWTVGVVVSAELLGVCGLSSLSWNQLNPKSMGAAWLPVLGSSRNDSAIAAAKVYQAQPR